MAEKAKVVEHSVPVGIRRNQVNIDRPEGGKAESISLKMPSVLPSEYRVVEFSDATAIPAAAKTAAINTASRAAELQLPDEVIFVTYGRNFSLYGLEVYSNRPNFRFTSAENGEVKVSFTSEDDKAIDITSLTLPRQGQTQIRVDTERKICVEPPGAAVEGRSRYSCLVYDISGNGQLVGLSSREERAGAFTFTNGTVFTSGPGKETVDRKTDFYHDSDDQNTYGTDFSLKGIGLDGTVLATQMEYGGEYKSKAILLSPDRKRVPITINGNTVDEASALSQAGTAAIVWNKGQNSVVYLSGTNVTGSYPVKVPDSIHIPEDFGVPELAGKTIRNPQASAQSFARVPEGLNSLVAPESRNRIFGLVEGEIVDNTGKITDYTSFGTSWTSDEKSKEYRFDGITPAAPSRNYNMPASIPNGPALSLVNPQTNETLTFRNEATQIKDGSSNSEYAITASVNGGRSSIEINDLLSRKQIYTEKFEQLLAVTQVKDEMLFALQGVSGTAYVLRVDAKEIWDEVKKITRN
jgi:hypothetical protein